MAREDAALSGCPELFQAHPQAMGWCGAGFLVLGMVGMPSQKTRWCWALLQHVQASPGEPRSSCNELWLLQKDAFCKDETVSTPSFAFLCCVSRGSLGSVMCCGVWACMAAGDGQSGAGQYTAGCLVLCKGQAGMGF